MSGDQLPYILGWLLKALLVTTSGAVSVFALWAGSFVLLSVAVAGLGFVLEVPVEGDRSYSDIFRR